MSANNFLLDSAGLATHTEFTQDHKIVHGAACKCRRKPSDRFPPGIFQLRFHRDNFPVL